MSGVESEDAVDRRDEFKEACKADCPHVKAAQAILDRCTERVNSKSYTAETCHQETVEFVEALDHCVGSAYFKALP